jgi:ER degradation enhancer, mannosidase alpha-like 2
MAVRWWPALLCLFLFSRAALTTAAAIGDEEGLVAAAAAADGFRRMTVLPEDHPSPERVAELRETVLELFRHAYQGYMEYGFPHDELLPLACEGKDSLGGYGVQLVDALPALRVVGLDAEFEDAVVRCEQLDFDRDADVSVFETNIRSVGGLLSGHLLALEFDFVNHTYTGGLLERAVDLATRLLPAFSHTKTGLPMREVNLRSGVPEHVGHRISAAEAGTFSLEFGLLSLLSGDTRFREAADTAIDAVWRTRVKRGLVSSEIDAFTGKVIRTGLGKWLSVGSGVDSFYEYLLKADMLFGAPRRRSMFFAAQRAMEKYLKQGPWYVGIDLTDMKTIDPVFRNLDAYLPGLLVLAGESYIPSAADTLSVMMGVAEKFGGTTPEVYDIHADGLMIDDTRYQLRPELAESLFYLLNATGNPDFLVMAETLVDGLALCRTGCGLAALDVSQRQKLDHMETFVLSETLMYLYLVFSDGKNPVLEKHPGLVFTTEGHPLWMPEGRQ